MVEAVDDFSIDKAVKVGEVADHAGFKIYRATYRYLDHVIVPMPIGVIALTVYGGILRLGQLVAVQAMRRRDHIAPGQVNF
jgi:type III secretory pathway component EscU